MYVGLVPAYLAESGYIYALQFVNTDVG